MRIAINGFGRIGRLTARLLLERDDLELVAINDLAPVNTLAHLFQFDSIHGVHDSEIRVDDRHMVIDNSRIFIANERNPIDLPWEALGIDLVIESTGIFRSLELARGHIKAGAEKVLISAPATGAGIKTIVVGVNDHLLTSEDRVVSNASCTTNCLAPLAKILHDAYEIESGFITTVHAYTSDQNIQDGPHRDLRRARAAALSIIPTSTGAAKAVEKVIPELRGRLDGLAMRVPVPSGSITDFTAVLKRKTSVAELHELFECHARDSMKHILKILDHPLVSADIVGSSYSSIIDPFLTRVVGDQIKICAWYDNEAGYANRVVDLASKMVRSIAIHQ